MPFIACADNLLKPYARSQDGNMCRSQRSQHCGADGAAYQPIHPLFFRRNHRLAREEEFSSRQADPWTVMTCQEKITGNLLYWGFALSLLLVYLALAARYESWIPPLAVISAVPLALPAADP
jgi:AcrB/AcrD/AcrF family